MPQHSALPEPERAIRHVESLHQLQLTVHDLDGRLRGLVDAERLSHRHAACLAAKASGAARCLAFDVEAVRLGLPEHERGVLRDCPFGVREASIACRREGRLAWVLFAGPVLGDDLTVLESLRQLAARLRLWEEEHTSWPRSQRVDRAGAGAPANRAARIRRWIAVHHHEDIGLDDLAAELDLSTSQCSRTVRDTCGQGFKQLLIAERLATARALLDETDLPVTDIAIRAGFGHRSHFQRVFKKVTGLTPGAFRQRGPPGSDSGF